MKIIHVNKHRDGKVGNMCFGVLGILDGIVRLFSFGFLHTDLQLRWARNSAARSITKQKKMCELGKMEGQNDN